MRVLFVVRDDATSKPGGDVDLAKSFSKIVEEFEGFFVSTVSYGAFDAENADIAVLFNIDQPFDNYLVARACLRNHVPYLIYTLHHKTDAVARFLRHGTHGTQWLVARFARSSPFAYETIMGAVRSMTGSRIGRLLQYVGMKQAARYVLKNADCVLVSCEAEAHFLAEDFGVSDAPIAIVPHFFPSRPILTDEVEREQTPIPGRPFILCAGRIEPRKNQLSVAKLASLHPEFFFLFIGKKNSRHPSYIRKFDEVLNTTDNLEWRDHVSYHDLFQIIRNCTIYINMSWFEVFSLIDLMALAEGKKCILSTGSYLGDTPEQRHNPLVKLVPPEDVDGVSECISDLSRALTPSKDSEIDALAWNNSIKDAFFKILEKIRIREQMKTI